MYPAIATSFPVALRGCTYNREIISEARLVINITYDNSNDLTLTYVE